MIKQPTLFGHVPQPRYVKPESIIVYQAVLELRRKGHAVYRAGRGVHSVDGLHISSVKQLIALARVAA